MFSRASTTTSSSACPPSDRTDHFPSHPHDPDFPPDGYEFDSKRQRLLHSSSASDILPSYYRPHPYFPPTSSAVLQSSIASSLSSYFASDPSLQQQFLHGSLGATGSCYVPQASASGMYSSSPNPYRLNDNHIDSVGSDLDHFNCTDIDLHHNHGHNRMRNSSVNHSYLNNNMAGNPNHRVRATSPPSARMLMPSYQSMGSSSSLSTSLSPFHSKSPFSRHHHHHHHLGPPSSPTQFSSSIERMSPRALGSSPILPSPFFRRFPSPPVLPRIFPAVKLRGLPFNCSENDVCDFFRGLDVVDVLLLHKQGRFSGEAYCVFGVPMQVDLALRRNKRNMGQRYIEVFRTKKQDYYLAVAAQVTNEREKIGFGETPSTMIPNRSSVDKEHLEHTGILKLRGLPFSASKKDVKDFFKDSDLKDDNIHFVVHSDGRATGEAYVEFKGPAQSKQAMSRDKMMLGSRYVELFPSSKDEVCKAMGHHKR